MASSDVVRPSVGASLVVLWLTTLGASPTVAQENPWFELEELNPLLGSPSNLVDRRTPRGAMRSFLVAADEGRWADAVHLLDLSAIESTRLDVAAETLARKLHAVIQRKAVIDWPELNERPDGLRVIGGQNEAQAGEPRRSILIADLAADPAPFEIRLSRVKAGEGDAPAWVFSRETVAAAPALYDLYGPSPFEARLPAALRKEGPRGLMWWEWIGLPLLAAVAVALAWLIHRGFDPLSRIAANRMAGSVLRAVRTPAMLTAVTTFVVWVSTNVLVFSGRIDSVLSPLIAIGYVTAVLMLIVNVVEAILDNLIAPGDDVDLTAAERQEARTTATKLNAGKRILTVAVFLLGCGVVLASADVFRGLGLSLLASAGAVTVVLGFAARRVLGNIMASLQIALNQSARVGDRVMYKGELCYVERIHMTYVQLRDWDDTRLIVPVEEFAYETFSNWTIQDPAMKRILKFKLTPHTDVGALRARFETILRDVARSEDLGPEIGDLDDAEVNIVGQDVFGIDAWFFVPCVSPNTSWTVACEVRERLLVEMRDMRDGTGRSVFPDPAAAEAA